MHLLEHLSISSTQKVEVGVEFEASMFQKNKTNQKTNLVWDLHKTPFILFFH